MSQDADDWGISDPGLLSDFRHIAHRSQSIARQLHEAYGAGRKSIRFGYVDGEEFNAFAGADNKGYVIELNKAVPLFSIILFYRLLSDPEVLPHLDASGDLASNFSLPFVVDPADFDRRSDWQIKTSAIRAFAAGTIADFCSTFVVCHELGHILYGHVEGMRFHYGDASLAELVSRNRSFGVDTARRRAWEYDADRFSAVLMIQFVEELVADRRSQERTRSVFSDPDGFHAEHTLAIAVASLFAFFVYVQGMRTKLDRVSSHPHPYVRATYLKHMLLQAARDRRRISLRSFQSLLDRRLDEFMIALARIGLLDARSYTPAYIKQVEVELSLLETLSQEHRDSCAPWRWIS